MPPPLPRVEPAPASPRTVAIANLGFCIAAIGSPLYPVAPPRTEKARSRRRLSRKVATLLGATTTLLIAPLVFFSMGTRDTLAPRALSRPATAKYQAPVSPSKLAPQENSPSDEQSFAPASRFVELDPVFITASPHPRPPPSPDSGESAPTTANVTRRDPVAASGFAASKTADNGNEPSLSPINSTGTETPFDTSGARSALLALPLSSTCGESATGRIRVAVTFAPSGRATHATVEDGLQGTEAGSCVARALLLVRVPAFAGGRRTVRMHLVLPR